MDNIILKVENVSKQYRLGTLGTGTISHDLNRWWHAVCGKENPYLKIGETNDRSKKGNSEYIWTLKDISFEVKRGEILGVIGRNGAGKSTLLKILSKVTSPSTGTIKSKGRIASLLEVGTGFHPEMTGKENVFLNGAILGMTKKEITEKLDEIIEFSGCHRYMDTPVKRYSSGMKVRLAFAVAAYLEPEILVVDEVLAVGDAEFQKKAIGKMHDISNSEGRTVLFVSHNMGAIRALCDRCVVLNNGIVYEINDTENAIKDYVSINRLKLESIHNFKNIDDLSISVKKISLLNQDNINTVEFFSGDQLKIEIEFFNNSIINNFDVLLGIYDEYGEKYSHLDNKNLNMTISNKVNKIIFEIEKLPLIRGEFSINLSIHSLDSRVYSKESIISFSVEPGDFYNSNKNIISNNRGKYLLNYRMYEE